METIILILTLEQGILLFIFICGHHSLDIYWQLCIICWVLTVRQCYIRDVCPATCTSLSYPLPMPLPNVAFRLIGVTNSLRWPMLQGLSSNLPISHHRLWCQFQPISLTLNLDIFSRYLQCNLSPSRLDLYLPSVICNMLLVVVIHILMYLCLSIICKCC